MTDRKLIAATAPSGHRSGRNTVLALVAMGIALVLSGCGIGIDGNRTSKSVSIRVTSDFGTTAIGNGSRKTVPTASTVLDFTKSFFTVATSHGSGTVRSIDGHAADSAANDKWAFYVNGIEADQSASLTTLHPGDHVWWDLHDSHATQDIPAIVGSYPEPFLTGTGGQSYPTTVTCANPSDSACTAVTKSLSDNGIKVSFQGLGTGSGSDSLAVLVGTFQQLQGTIAGELLTAPKGGPQTSGVFGQFIVAKQGSVLELDNPDGEVVQTYHGSIGLIAAIEQQGLNEPVWLVTGTDRAGVAAAAKALTVAKLADHFAVAVKTDGTILPLPLSPTG